MCRLGLRRRVLTWVRSSRRNAPGPSPPDRPACASAPESWPSAALSSAPCEAADRGSAAAHARGCCSPIPCSKAGPAPRRCPSPCERSSAARNGIRRAVATCSPRCEGPARAACRAAVGRCAAVHSWTTSRLLGEGWRRGRTVSESKVQEAAAEEGGDDEGAQRSIAPRADLVQKDASAPSWHFGRTVWPSFSVRSLRGLEVKRAYCINSINSMNRKPSLLHENGTIRPSDC